MSALEGVSGGRKGRIQQNIQLQDLGVGKVSLARGDGREGNGAGEGESTEEDAAEDGHDLDIDGCWNEVLKERPQRECN